MTTASEFVEAVETKTSDITGLSVGPTHICGACLNSHGFDATTADDMREGLENGDICDEGGFSSSSCECCGSRLGGNRYAAHGWIEIDGKAELCHLDVCTDCLIFIANGEEPENWER